MRPDSITLAIFEKYTAEELAITAAQLVQALANKETVETEKKLSDSAFKERINQHETTANNMAKKYAKGGETAQIGCHIRYDVPTVGKKSYIRMDSEEVVEVHDMSLEEKQETIQFPLSTREESQPATDEPKSAKDKKHKPVPEPEPEVEAPISAQTSELYFKDIQGIAANIVKLPEEHRAAAIADMQGRIATTLRVQKGCIGPDGRVETIDSQAVADSFAKAWLELAIERELHPAAEPVTRMCPYPACILFAEHEGDHEFPKGEVEAQPAQEVQPETQPEREKKTRRKKRDFATPPEPPCQEGPQPPAGD